MEFSSKFTFAFVLLIANLLVDAQQVPCLFFFGDSQFDNGNNNGLLTLAKVNYPPYGIDYPTGPTGRFANGRIVPDFLANYLGFPTPIPPFVTAIRGNTSIQKGLNYASGGAGILDETGFALGGRFTMNLQLLNHASIVSRIALQRGSSVSTVKNGYMTKCVYVVNIVSNDYLNNYLLPYSITRTLYTPEAFAQRLIQALNQQLRTLYSYGARKVAVFGAGLLGCVPQQIQAANAQGCVESVNNIVQPFNNEMKPLVDQLNNQLSGARFTYINTTSIASGDPRLLGIREFFTPCCDVSDITGLCIRNSIPCTNRSEYSFFDNYHVTSTLNQATAARIYSAALPTDAYPFDIRRLAQQ